VKAAIAFDGGSGDWTEADVQGVMANVREVRRSLRRLGFATTLVPVRLHDLKWLGRLQRTDVVFNLIEGINGVARYEDWAVGALELTGVPFTGCRATAVSLCHRKHVANTLLARAGVPVPACGLGRRNVVPEGLQLPVIVKPSGEDASVGIDGGAICTTRNAVRERLARMSEQFADVLVQEYIEGREFNVGFLGSEVLPLSEISFERMPAGYWPIVSYAAKWAEGSPEYVGTDPVCPARVDPALADRIITVARRAWEVLGGGEGYGRVDLRVAADGTPYVLEVNPNPDLSSDAGFARMGEALGWQYDALIGRVVEETMHRARRGAAADSLVRSVAG
jgi:D-alanine-D-alanine ligase